MTAVMTRRQFAAAGAALFAAGATADELPPRQNLGLLVYSYSRRAAAQKDHGFAEPESFVRFARSRGAGAVQLPLGIRTGAEAAALRRTAERLEVAVEGIVSPPQDEPADRERFVAELDTAAAAGAAVVRVVMLGGRRYEVFTRPDEYPAFARRAAERLRVMEPLAATRKLVLAVENHKDFRSDELLDLLRRLGSPWVGVCLDTGNNLALLEDPLTVVAALAPLARTVHLKDLAVEPADDGFRMAEVPLGQGVLDLKGMVAAIRSASPSARFQLEMITRDPLSVACLGEKYWATLGHVSGRDLARTLRLVRRERRPRPLVRVSALGPEEQLELEDRHVRESFAFAARTRLIPA